SLGEPPLQYLRVILSKTYKSGRVTISSDAGLVFCNEASVTAFQGFTTLDSDLLAQPKISPIPTPPPAA
ncbi:MAG TPA: hypothetical protein VJ184_03510, partial [Chryseolinea sp.]|nr:hypothetical protein [Chryseolinea sp.]